MSPTQSTRLRTGFEGAAGALLDRADHDLGATAEGVEDAAGALAEVGGQKEDADADEGSQHRPAPPDDIAAVAHAPGAALSQKRRRCLEFWFERWIASNSSKERPDPTATQVSGDSARWAGICVSSLIRSSRPCKQGPSPGKHDPAVHDVRGKFGRGAVQRLLHRVDDRLERLLQRHPNLLAGEHHRLRQPGDEVAAADLGLHLLCEREGGADLELDLLGRLLADHELVLALDVADDRLVELVAADADRLGHDDAAERDHGDLAGAAADVHDHVARGLADREAGADRGSHRLLDQIGVAGAGGEAGLLDRALLDPGHAGGHADHHARVRPAVLVDLLDEVAEHLLGHVEVGDHAVLERADRRDRARGSAEHALGLDAHGVDLAGAGVDRDHRRL